MAQRDRNKELRLTAYLFGDDLLQASTAEFAAAMQTAHDAGLRPHCVCVTPHLAMYVAKIAGRYYVKRMPNTGEFHAQDCDSYESPPELSGLSEVMGTAIKEDEENSTTALKVEFAMSKSPGRKPPQASGLEADSVQAKGTKLGLRSVLHYLWDEAGLNRWSPKMEGKRSWFLIYTCLRHAAAGKTIKNKDMASLLYVPEPFFVEQKSEIAARRQGLFLRLAKREKGAEQYGLLVGELKAIESARFGFKLVIKHAPDCHFSLAQELHSKLMKRFEQELELWSALEGAHMMVIATFGVAVTGIAHVAEVALMLVTETWIPFESLHDKQLVDAMTSERRRFTKGLRYNLPLDRPLAQMVATDVTPGCAMYIAAPDLGQDYDTCLANLIEQSTLGRWVWRLGAEPLPPLPRQEFIGSNPV